MTEAPVLSEVTSPEYLLKNSAGKVRVLDNMANGFKSNLAILKQYSAFEFIEGDIRNIDICQKACTGIDYVSHQAALGPVPAASGNRYISMREWRFCQCAHSRRRQQGQTIRVRVFVVGVWR